MESSRPVHSSPCVSERKLLLAGGDLFALTATGA